MRFLEQQENSRQPTPETSPSLLAEARNSSRALPLLQFPNRGLWEEVIPKGDLHEGVHSLHKYVPCKLVPE